MGTPTYTLISETVLGSAQASVTFSSIPGTYKDLVLEVHSGQTVNAFVHSIQFNNDTGNNYSYTYVYGNGSTAASSRVSNTSAISFLSSLGYTVDALNNVDIINIMSYANTNVNKTVVSRAGGGSYGGPEANVGLWRSTSAITSVKYQTNGGNIMSGSTLRLWGVVG